MDRLQVGAAARGLALVTPGPVEQHVEGAPDAGPIEGAGLGRELGLQLGKARALHVLGHLVVHLGGRRAGTRRILERERGGEAHLAHQRHGGGEVGVAFAGEADDEIRRQREVGPDRAQAIDDGAELVHRVLAVHGREHAIGARLHRQVEIGHQRRHVAMGRDQGVVHVARVGGGVADAREPLDLRQRPDQAPKRPLGRRRRAPRRARR